MNTFRKTMMAVLGLGVLAGASASAMTAMAQPGAFGPGEGGPMHRFRAMDANRDGMITKEELATFRQERFARLDANGDGKVDRNEIDQAIAKRLERRKVRMRYRMLARLDHDGDGVISKKEFEATAARLFRWADVNADGKVTREELAQLRRFRRWRGPGMMMMMRGMPAMPPMGPGMMMRGMHGMPPMGPGMMPHAPMPPR